MFIGREFGDGEVTICIGRRAHNYDECPVCKLSSLRRRLTSYTHVKMAGKLSSREDGGA